MPKVTYADISAWLSTQTNKLATSSLQSNQTAFVKSGQPQITEVLE